MSATKSVTELLSEAAPLADAVGFYLHYFLQNTLFCLVYPLLVTQEPLFEDDTTDKNDGIGHDEAANVQVIYISPSLKLINGSGIFVYLNYTMNDFIG